MNLSAKITKVPGEDPVLARITTDAEIPEPMRETEALLVHGEDSYDPEGFPAVLRVGPPQHSWEISLPDELTYLSEGDIVRINRGEGMIHVLYRRYSHSNVLFFTERCNSRCLMCSQPPRDIDDGHLIDEILDTIPLMSPETRELCITGGEPLLLGPKLIEVIHAVKHYLPSTALHMLSNGRLFSDLEYARAVAEVQHPDFMVGIPLYADVARRHDFVVQAKGAFDETIRGLMNLARCGVRIEIRFVIHRQTIDRMVETARFIVRNLPFVSHVALMGLEMMGFTKTNLEALWIDPHDYKDRLAATVEELATARFRTSIYNLPLCLLPQELWSYARKSISDWKNIYLPPCEPCVMKEECAGFFASAPLRYSSHLRPFLETPTQSTVCGPDNV